MRFHPCRAAAPVLILLAGCQHIPLEPLAPEYELARLRLSSTAIDDVQELAALLHDQNRTPIEFDASGDLSLNEAESVALDFNFELRRLHAEVERSAALAKTAARLPDPELGLDTGQKREETESEGGVIGAERNGIERSWINAASLSITIPLSGRRAAARNVAKAELTVAELAVTEAEWRVLTELRAEWARWSAEQERLRLLDQYIELIGHFAYVSRTLADAGELDPTDARLFEIERSRRLALRDRTAHILQQQRVKVLELMGLLPDAPVVLIPSLAAAPPAGTSEERAKALLENHPKLARMHAEYEVAEARLRLELRAQYPDITLSPTYTDEQNESSLTLGLGMPLPVWNANRQGIAGAAAGRDVARTAYVQALQEVHGQLASAEYAAAGAAAQRARLQAEVVPLVDQQLDQLRALLAIGEINVTVLYEALTQSLEIKQELLQAMLDEQIAWSGMVDLAPGPVEPTANEDQQP